MNTDAKLKILADAAKYDASCASSGGKRGAKSGMLGTAEGAGICHSYTPDGRCVSLLKILLTNYCIYDCLFCINRVSSNTPRARFTVDEVVRLTIEFYRRNYIEGLFLSSGIIESADYTMEMLVQVAKRLRTEHAFNGYVHLKAIPGCSQLLLDQAGRYADRLSANIELPRQKDLDTLAPSKTHQGIEASMSHLATRIRASRDRTHRATRPPVFARGGQSTQLIVGATSASDKDILHKATALYRGFQLKRVYYSAFSPIQHGDPSLPLEGIPLIREHRLYQADWLYRYYGFSFNELFSETDENFDIALDPKVSWALRNRQVFPIDINAADREMLLRIPGVGVRSVSRILSTRSQRSIRLVDLTKLGVAVRRAKFFIATADWNSALRFTDSESLRSMLVPAKQLSLFVPTTTSAITGEF